MRKNVIYCVPVEGDGILKFFFHAERKNYYLYYIRYRKIAHEFFRYGKSIEELNRRKDWRTNGLLRHLIEGPLTRRVKEVVKEESYAG